MQAQLVDSSLDLFAISARKKDHYRHILSLSLIRTGSLTKDTKSETTQHKTLLYT